MSNPVLLSRAELRKLNEELFQKLEDRDQGKHEQMIDAVDEWTRLKMGLPPRKQDGK